MSMNSALSLSFQNIIIYLQYVHCVKQKFHGKSISHKSDFFQREINASGEPTTQAITNWDTTKGTPLGQRGATRDKSPGTEV